MPPRDLHNSSHHTKAELNNKIVFLFIQNICEILSRKPPHSLSFKL